MGVAELKLWFSRELSDDVEFVSGFYGVAEKEWLLRAVKEMITSEKARVVNTVERLYVNGFIDESAFVELLGFVPDEVLKKKRSENSQTPATA